MENNKIHTLGIGLLFGLEAPACTWHGSGYATQHLKPSRTCTHRSNPSVEEGLDDDGATFSFSRPPTTFTRLTSSPPPNLGWWHLAFLLGGCVAVVDD